jgi:hypothetical protein
MPKMNRASVPSELVDAADVHVGRHRHALLGLAQEPRVEVLHVPGDLLEEVLLVGQPHVLERVQLAAGHVPVRRVEVLRVADLDQLVGELVLEEGLRQVRDRHVLVPAYVAEPEHLVLPEEAAARRGEGAQREREDRRPELAGCLRRRSLPVRGLSVRGFLVRGPPLALRVKRNVQRNAPAPRATMFSLRPVVSLRAPSFPRPCSPECVEGAFRELLAEGVLGGSRAKGRARATQDVTDFC